MVIHDFELMKILIYVEFVLMCDMVTPTILLYQLVEDSFEPYWFVLGKSI